MDAPSLSQIRDAAEQLRRHVLVTPTLTWQGSGLTSFVGPETCVNLKLEILQHTGTFKARGALSVLLNTPDEMLAKGVTAVSAGNHAIAVAFAANLLGLDAKLVMLESANPLRRALARDYGAEILIARDGPTGFALAEHIAATEGRVYVHPFEGPFTTLGTSTLGVEWIEQVDQPLDAIVVGIGGGGLMSGVATAFKALSPETEVIGVEPTGADTMHRSFAAGVPQTRDPIDTIADSLGAPMAMPYSFELCQKNVDRLVMVSDQQILAAMHLLFLDRKLAVEPAAAAGLAALLGPLRDDLRGKRVGLLLCGSNIDAASFFNFLQMQGRTSTRRNRRD
jgi:threonine dehydratase